MFVCKNKNALLCNDSVIYRLNALSASERSPAVLDAQIRRWQIEKVMSTLIKMNCYDKLSSSIVADADGMIGVELNITSTVSVQNFL